jgi:hypothetical protein
VTEVSVQELVVEGVLPLEDVAVTVDDPIVRHFRLLSS